MSIDDHSHDQGHPAPRPAEPDHPLILDGGMVPGDPALMVRCMTEEMLQLGISGQEIVAMSRDPNYQALFAARAFLGEEAMDALIHQCIARVGVHRHRTVEQTGEFHAVELTIGLTD